MEILLIILLTISLASTPIIYRLGLKDGLDLNKGKEIQPIVTLPRIESIKTEKTKEDFITEGLNNLMTYDGSPTAKKE